MFYNISMDNITITKNNEETKLISKKIKLFLSQIGLNERYQSFKYLAYILEQMVLDDKDSFEFFNYNLEVLSKKYNISKRTISCGISLLLEGMKDYCSLNTCFFNLTSYGTLNKIRALKQEFLHSI